MKKTIKNDIDFIFNSLTKLCEFVEKFIRENFDVIKLLTEQISYLEDIIKKQEEELSQLINDKINTSQNKSLTIFTHEDNFVKYQNWVDERFAKLEKEIKK